MDLTKPNSAAPASPTAKKKKSQGPIRFEAVVPFGIVVALIIVYFTLFFDRHLKNSFEWLGYLAMGSEVNVAQLHTSFLNGTFRMQGLEITNAEKPTHDSLKIGDIRFGFLWDALLRAKFVVEEIAVEQIEIDTPRKSPGKVKPPDPPPVKSTQPSQLEIEATKLKNQALKKTERELQGNVFGDLARFLNSGGQGPSLEGLTQNLASQKKLKEIEGSIQEKQKKWQDLVSKLPQAPEIQALGNQLSQIKTSGFNSPQDLQSSVQQFESLIKKSEEKINLVKSTSGQMQTDAQGIDAEFKNIDQIIKKDIADLESKFSLPKIDAKSITKSLFMPYLDPYLSKINHYKALLDKYIPPNAKTSKEKGSNPDEEFKPHPRAKGITYEFSRPNSYPIFWIKKISITSQSKGQPQTGDLAGLITNITSNQALIKKPTEAQFTGGFPNLNLEGLFGKIVIDNTASDSLVDFQFKVGSYLLNSKELVNSPDVKLGFQKAKGDFSIRGNLKSLSQINYSLVNNIKNIDYIVESSNSTVKDILVGVFHGIPVVLLEAYGEGTLPDFNLNITSNLGPEIQKGFEKQLQKRINEAKERIQKLVRDSIGKERAKVEAEINSAKTQAEAEIKKVQDQLQAQKSQGEDKINQAKKDAENQAKKALGEDAQKKIDDLKKKLGF